MKKLKLFTMLFILALMIILFSSPLCAQGYDWKIKSFISNVDVRTDRAVEVTEEIKTDFKSQMHGIYRYIPIIYGKGSFGSNSVGFKLISITDEGGNPYNYTSGYENDNIYFKIGDKDRTITGEHIYRIKYIMKNAVKSYKMNNFAPGVNEYDEFYFNVTGNGWAVDIDYAQAAINLPKAADREKMRIKAFTGSYGEKNENCTAKIIKGQTYYFSARGLKPYEGLTVLAGWPSGIIQRENKTAKTISLLLMNWYLFMPFLVLIALISLWYKHGRDIKRGSAIMALYEPPKKKDGKYFSPADVGVIIDEKFDPRDFTAEVINLAVKGYIKIKEIESKALFFFSNKDYELEQLLKDKAPLSAFEQDALRKLFKGAKGNKIKLSDLKDEFYEEYADLKKDKYKELVKEGVFVSDPEKTRSNYIAAGIAVMIISIPASIFMAFVNIIFINNVFWAVLAGVICGLEFILFAPLMPKKTDLGAEVLNQIYGFEDYIKTAESNRIEWEVSENIFEKYLPYAMAMRIEDKWAKRFADIYKDPPDWYASSTPMMVFSTSNFVHSMNQTSQLMSSAFTSAPRSSGGSGFSSGGGGGFSGGGSGGGGGGGW